MSFVTTRTPHRISFFGGGTDYPAWYRNHGGKVLSAAIDKYCYITCRYLPPFFENKHRIVWSHIENVSDISEILHPAVREGLRLLEFDNRKGIELHHMSDVPARAGMGSSSAFANGLILALKTLRHETIPKEQMYYQAIRLEQECLKEHVGSQDQVATAMGGINRIEFHKDGHIDVEPLADKIGVSRVNELQSNLMLFYTGTSRIASKIAESVVGNLNQRESDLEALSNLVDKACALLENQGNLDDFGAMLDETWRHKKRLAANVTNDHVNSLYEQALAAGALGGKLLGAGSAGFMLFYVPEDKQQSVRDALKLLEVPFCFEFSGCTVTSSFT